MTQPYDGTTDLREQLVNGRAQGPIAQVSLPRERVTTLHGILGDLDPGLYLPNNPLFAPAADPGEFYKSIVPVVNRHPVWQHAEVRASGSGLHLIVWLEPPVELRSAGDQEWWDAAVDVLRSTLPSDPNAPGITALTRPVGSVNGKNGRRVECLREGQPVTAEAVEQFVREVDAAPFREVARVLLGGEQVSPCPVCREPGSRLDALDRVGKCYGCGKVGVDGLYDLVFADG